MIDFLQIAQNYGDFSGRQWQPDMTRATDAGLREGPARGYDFNDLAYSQRDSAYGDANVSGMVQVSTRNGARYQRKLYEASKLITQAMKGNRRAMLNLVEALSISDFPNLFGDIIDRGVLANYRETPYTWNMVANLSQVSDFRQVKRFRIDYGTASSTKPIDMGGPYPEDKIADNAAAGATGQAAGAANTAGYYAYNLLKYGKRMPFFWETFMNDDLNAIKDVPARFGRGMRRSEERFVTTLYANNTTFFSNSNFANTVVPSGVYTATNPTLSITALAQALTIMSQQRDKDGEPIEIEAVTLVVPPALKVTAANILNADYFWANDQGGTVIGAGSGATASNTSGQRLNVANWARNIVKLAVNYYLPIVDATHGSSGWYVFADPNGGRPALEFGKLRGHEQPELFMKLPNSVAIGEGAFGPGAGITPGTMNQNPMEGDFDTDSIHYKIRHVFGGTTIDPLCAVYSNGSGS